MSDEKEQKGVIGRPPIGQEGKDDLLRKLRPYLQAGLSVYKACAEAKVPKSTVYDLIEKDADFSEEINRIRQFLSVLASHAIASKVNEVAGKVTKKEKISGVEIDFLKWFVMNSNLTKEEFGSRQSITTYDPESELRKTRKVVREALKQKEVEEVKDEPVSG